MWWETHAGISFEQKNLGLKHVQGLKKENKIVYERKKKEEQIHRHT